MSRFVDELKRRGVIRAAILYVGFAFGTLEIVDMLGPRLGLPDSAFMYSLTFFAVGFPFAMWLSWTRQITLEGIQPEPDADSAEPIPESDRRRSDRIIIAVLAFAVVAFAANEFMPRISSRNVQPLHELGREQLIERTETSIVEAERNFRRAIEIDKNFAPAYAGLAEAITIQAFKGLTPRQAAFDEVRGIVETGLDLDPSIGELYANKANVLWELDDDVDEAERLYKQAIELSPKWIRGYQWYAEFLIMRKGEHDKALAVLNNGRELERYDPLLVDRIMWVAFSRRNITDYEDLLRETIRRHPDFLKNYVSMINALKEQGRIGEMLKWSEYVSQEDEENFQRRVEFECWAWLLLEEFEEARECTAKLERDFADEPKKVMIAQLWLGNGHKAAEAANKLMQSGPAESVMQFDSGEERKIVRLLGGMIGDILVESGQWDLARSFNVWQGNPVFTDPEWKPSAADLDNIPGAILNAAILYETGDKELGNELFDLVLEKINDEDLTTKAGASYRQVWAHAFRGDASAAKAYLRVAMTDQKHLEDWHRLRGPVFELLKDDEEFQALFAEIEARAAAEREWYEKHKDEPLFKPLK